MVRKILKMCFWALGPILLLFLIVRCNYHHRTASDYERVFEKLNVCLPDVKDVEAFDNYDRGASRWDCLEYNIQFDSPLPEKTVRQLERKVRRRQGNWFKESGPTCVVYTYVSEKEWESDLFFLKCQILDDLESDKDSAYIEYYIDEDEAVFNFILIALLVFGMLFGLLIYGVVSAVSSAKND